MGDIHEPKPVLLLIAVISRYEDALRWAEERACQQFGPLHKKSPAFDFVETEYYEATMGGELKKQFLTFEKLIDPGDLPQIKRTTNAWESEYSEIAKHCESRPLNLDPGYLTLAKLVLASTKDHSHRIYLADGIFAEITLNYRSGGWQNSAWTYPDYQRQDFQEFFSECRKVMPRF